MALVILVKKELSVQNTTKIWIYNFYFSEARSFGSVPGVDNKQSINIIGTTFVDICFNLKQCAEPANEISNNNGVTCIYQTFYSIRHRNVLFRMERMMFVTQKSNVFI